MKVLLTTMALGLGGGTDLVVLDAARAIQSRGHTVELHTVDPTDWGSLGRTFPEVARLPEVAWLSRREPQARHPPSWLQRVRWYRRILSRLWHERRGCLIVNLNGDILPAPAHLTCVYFPLAASEKWPEASPWRSSLSRRVIPPLLRLENRRSLRQAHTRIVAISTYTQEAVRAAWGVPSTVVHPPVQLFLPEPPPGTRANAIVTVASFRHRKRLDRVLEVARLVPDARFSLLGASGPESGPILADLQTTAAKEGFTARMTFGLDAPRAEVEGQLWKSKIYLHPTPHEHFGISLVEAMQAGCVPVIPRSGGQWTDILEAKDGIWGYGYDTPEEAATRIRSVLEDDSLQRRMSARAQERGLQFSRDRFRERFLNVFEEVVSSATH